MRLVSWKPLTRSWGADTAGQANSLGANSLGGDGGSGAPEHYLRSIGQFVMQCRHASYPGRESGAWLAVSKRPISPSGAAQFSRRVTTGSTDRTRRAGASHAARAAVAMTSVDAVNVGGSRGLIPTYRFAVSRATTAAAATPMTTPAPTIAMPLNN